MDINHLHGILLKSQERISKDDRQRLNFFLGDNITQRLQEDLSLRSALSTILFLFDQDNINQEDMILLINAANEIHCTDFAQYLKQHMKQMQLNEVKQSQENLIQLLPVTTAQDEENCHLQNDRNNTKFNPFTVVLDDSAKDFLRSKRKPIIKICFLLFIILSIILTLIVIGEYFKISQLRMKYENIINGQEKNNEIIQYLKIIQSTNEENNQQLKIIKLINEENNQYLKGIQSKNEENKQDLKGTSSNYNETTQVSTTKNFFEEDRKFTEGFKCGCDRWCKKRGSSYGVCGNGPTCICTQYPITKDNVGNGCTCDGWCKRHGHQNGGICGDGYTCICSK